MLRQLFRIMVSLSAPANRREMIIDDLDEEWTYRIRPQVGLLQAHLWYVKESISLVLVFQRDRVSGKWRTHTRPRRRTNGSSPMRIDGFGNGWWQDMRQTVRGLLRTPSFSTIAVLTLAVGMGGTVIMFSLVHAAYLRPLPYPNANQLVRIFTAYEHDLNGRNAISPLTWQDAAQRPELLSDTEVWERRSYHLSDEGSVRRVPAVRVSPGLFSLLGATPAIGRLFIDDDAIIGGEHSVILSHQAWVQSFGADSAILNRSIVLDDAGYRVVGVLEPDFPLVRDAQMWVPLALGPEWYEGGRRGWEFLEAAGELREGISPAVAGNGLTQQLALEAPDRVERVGQRVNVVPFKEHLVGDAGAVVLVLLAAVIMVLVIGSANVMNLVLARSETRRREFALRRALGAGSGRLARLVVLETLSLSVAGGVTGLLAAAVIMRVVSAAPPDSLASLTPLTVGWQVAAFAAALSISTGLLFGLAPAIGSLGSHPGEALRAAASRNAGSIGGRRFRAALVVSEVALAVVLVFGVGVTAESYRRMTAVEPGFEASEAVAVNLEMPGQGYSGAQRGQTYQRILERVHALSGVSQAALTYALPLTGVQWSASFDLVEPNPSLPESALGANMRPVSPGYFAAMNIPVIEGRVLEDADAPGAPPVVVVDETLARRVWPGRAPIGQRIDLGVFLGGERQATVVGVVGNVLDLGFSSPPSAHLYFSAWQSPQRRMILVAETAGDAQVLAAAIRSAVAQVEPRVPVYDVRPVSSVIAESLEAPRSSLLLMGAFAGVALLLAAIGVHGVLSYTVALRTREIGTRMALGATPTGVVRLILRQVTLLWMAGSVVGGVAAFSLSALVRRMLFDVNPSQPVFVATAIVGLGMVALVAGVVPARRAARLDCIEALRQF
jgi:predicted permease